TGPLATFSARIDMAYLLGLIPDNVRRELHLIRKIRNDFAHSSENLDFNNEAIANRCRELSRASWAREKGSEPRVFYIQATMGIAGILDATAHQLAEGTLKRCVAAEILPPTDGAKVITAVELYAERLAEVIKSDEASADSKKAPPADRKSS